MLSELQASRYRLIMEHPRRGEIFDANGELLATSKSFLEIGVDRHELRGDELSKLPIVAKQLGMSLSEVHKAFGVVDGRLPTNPKSVQPRWRPLKRHVDPRSFAPVKELGMRCLTSTTNYERVYPKNGLASHIVGYTRKDGEAVLGVEREFDFYLSGERGWKESEVGGRNGEMAQFRRRSVSSKDGLNVVLTIDSYVQHAIERELEEIARSYDPVAATIIVTDPYSGDILGLGNYPSFDPNEYSKATEEAQKNRALTDILEPGSTFKIIAATAALEERVVSIETRIDCSVPIVVMPDGYRLKLPKDDHPMGLLSVGEVISKSSNRGVAHLGMKLGDQNFHDWVSKYGFGQYTGLDMGIESKGIVNPVRSWDRLTLSRMTMGHSIAATPLQIHMATATLANGGILMKPRIVSKITNYENEDVIEFGPLPRRKVVSRSTANVVSRLLEDAASSKGTARRAFIEGYRVAGKTGTSQKIVDGRYSSSQHIGSFSGFFPADNPQLVITVIVDGARLPGVAYGGVVAAPSFRNIALKLIPHYAIRPSDEPPGLAYSPDWNSVEGTN